MNVNEHGRMSRPISVVQYHEMGVAVAEIAGVDGSAVLSDNTTVIAAYACYRDIVEFAVWLSADLASATV